MRLIKIALGNVNPTVGAVRSNVDRVLGPGPGDGCGRGDGRVLHGAGGGRLSHRGPDPVAGVPRRPAERARAVRRGDGRPSHRVRGGGGGGGRRADLQLRRGGPRRRDPRLRPQGEAPHLQRLLRGPHLLARRAGARPRRRRRPPRRLSLRLRLRPAGGRGLRGRLVAGRADAAALLLGGGAGGQRLGLAVPRRGGLDPPRDARHPLGGQPGDARLRQLGRRPGRPGVRRRRLRLPERPADARGAAVPRGVGGLRGRSRPHGAGPPRDLDLARRLRGLPAPGDPRAGAAERSSHGALRFAAVPGAGLGEPLPAGRRGPGAHGARGGAGRPDRGAGPGSGRLLREVGGLPHPGDRALGRARLDAHPADRLAGGLPPGEWERDGRGSPASAREP